jgi:hypothetical protein
MKSTERAYRILLVYAQYAGNDEKDECNLRDLLCDLRHLADVNGQDWDQELKMANANYLAEKVEFGTGEVWLEALSEQAIG